MADLSSVVNTYFDADFLSFLFEDTEAHLSQVESLANSKWTPDTHRQILGNLIRIDSNVEEIDQSEALSELQEEQNHLEVVRKRLQVAWTDYNTKFNLNMAGNNQIEDPVGAISAENNQYDTKKVGTKEEQAPQAGPVHPLIQLINHVKTMENILYSKSPNICKLVWTRNLSLSRLREYLNESYKRLDTKTKTSTEPDTIAVDEKKEAYTNNYPKKFNSKKEFLEDVECRICALEQYRSFLSQDFPLVRMPARGQAGLDIIWNARKGSSAENFATRVNYLYQSICELEVDDDRELLGLFNLAEHASRIGEAMGEIRNLYSILCVEEAAYPSQLINTLEDRKYLYDLCWKNLTPYKVAFRYITMKVESLQQRLIDCCDDSELITHTYNLNIHGEDEISWIGESEKEDQETVSRFYQQAEQLEANDKSTTMEEINDPDSRLNEFDEIHTLDPRLYLSEQGIKIPDTEYPEENNPILREKSSINQNSPAEMNDNILNTVVHSTIEPIYNNGKSTKIVSTINELESKDQITLFPSIITRLNNEGQCLEPSKAMVAYLDNSADKACICLDEFMSWAVAQGKTFDPLLVELAWKINQIANGTVTFNPLEFTALESNTSAHVTDQAIFCLKTYALEAFRCADKPGKTLMRFVRVLINHPGSSETLRQIELNYNYSPRHQTRNMKKNCKEVLDCPLLTDTEEPEETLDWKISKEISNNEEIRRLWYKFFRVSLWPLEYCIVRKLDLYLNSLKPEEKIEPRIMELAKKTYLLARGKGLSGRECDEDNLTSKPIVEESLVGNMIEYYSEVWANCEVNQDFEEVKVSDRVFEAMKKVLKRAKGECGTTNGE